MPKSKGCGKRVPNPVFSITEVCGETINEATGKVFLCSKCQKSKGCGKLMKEGIFSWPCGTEVQGEIDLCPECQSQQETEIRDDEKSQNESSVYHKPADNDILYCKCNKGKNRHPIRVIKIDKNQSAGTDTVNDTADTLKSKIREWLDYEEQMINVEDVKEFIRHVEKRYNRYVACNGVCGVPIEQILKEESGFDDE